MNMTAAITKTWDTFTLPEILLPFQQTGFEIVESLKNGGLFLSRFIENPDTVGSIIPSSQRLAEKIIRHIPESKNKNHPGNHYLEIGPGTGSFTSEIVKRLAANDELDVVEIDPTFCELLKKKYADKPNVHVHCKSITEWSPDYKYDAIISGLPLNAFSPEQVEEFIRSFKTLAKDDGTISYFEYAFLPTLKVKFLSTVKTLGNDVANLLGTTPDIVEDSGRNLVQFQKVLALKKAFYHTFGIDSETVYFNFPPARVLHFKIGANDAPSPVSPLPNSA